MMKRKTKAFLWLSFVLAWAVVAFVTLEVHEAYRLRRLDARMATLAGQNEARKQELERAVIRRYGLEPPDVGTDIRERATYAGLDVDARDAFAARRGELVLTVDGSGTIRETHCAPGHETLAALARKVQPGAAVYALLNDAEAADARIAVAEALRSGNTFPREYEIPEADVSGYVAQFYFVPEPGQGLVHIFLRDSMWEKLWVRFRKNVYQNDAYEFRTNSFGFRDREIVVPKPDGVVRIVCIGGSTTAEGPTNDLTYPKMVEAKLRAAFATDRIEVINAGVFASWTDLDYHRLDEYLALEPDLLVHYNFVNDITNFFPGYLREREHSSALERCNVLVKRSRVLYRYCNDWFFPPSSELRDWIGKHVLINLELLEKDARARGVGLAVCSFAAPDVAHLPRMERDFFEWRISFMLWGRMMHIEQYCGMVAMYNELLKALCAERGLTYIPVAEGLRGGMDSFTDICHMNLAAMDRKAGIVADALRDYVAERLGAGAAPEPAF